MMIIYDLREEDRCLQSYLSCACPKTRANWPNAQSESGRGNNGTLDEKSAAST
jgi:hypothetical protein